MVLLYSLVVCFLISSCGNERGFDLTPTIIVATDSPTLVMTDNPKTFTPTSTATPSCNFNKKLSLVDAILTSEDMITKYPIFKIGDRWTESIDLTNELTKDNLCQSECAKQLWSPTKVSIVLINNTTIEEANKHINDIRQSFTNILEITDRPYISDIASNAWVAYDYSNQEFVLLYSYGKIFVHIVNRPAVGFDDFAGEFDLIFALGKTQNEKLCNSGFSF